MLHKVMVVLKTLQAQQIVSGEKVTIGEISRMSKIPKTTVRRLLGIAENSNLVDCETVNYKSTGKRVFWITATGGQWLDGYRSMF